MTLPNTSEDNTALTKESWDRAHENKWGSGKAPEQWVMHFVRGHRDEIDGSILDLGCGDGRQLVPLRLEGLNVVGFDISETGLKDTRRKLRELGLGTELDRGEMHEPLPYEDEQFGGAISIQVVSHNRWPEIEKTFAEVERVLKKGSYFAWKARSTEYWCEPREQVEDYGYTAQDTEGKKKGVDQHYFSRDEIDELAERHGFEVVGEPFESRDEWEYKKGLKAHWNVVFRAV